MGKVYEPLVELIEQAKQEGKYLHCAYQDICFTPFELEDLNHQGRFCWGPVNWQLVTPDSLVADEQRMLRGVQKSIIRIEQRNAEFAKQCKEYLKGNNDESL